MARAMDLPLPDSLGPALTGLPAARREILVLLKKRGEAGVADLAQALGVTPSAVRQHLSGLAADGLLVHRVIKGGLGRPRHIYRLSTGAEALFPKFYGELATELLSYVHAEDPNALERVFDRRSRRRVEGARSRLDGLDFDDRVSGLARILDEDGYLADFERMEDGTYRITEHNCAILSAARQYRLACSTEIEFIREVLPEADVERVAHMMAGAHVCQYEVRPRAVRAARGAGRRTRATGTDARAPRDTTVPSARGRRSPPA